MAAAIHPPHPFPSLGQLRPRLVVVPRERTRPRAGVYRRRRVVALALVMALSLAGALAAVRVVSLAASAFSAGRATSVEVTTAATGATTEASTSATATGAAPLPASPTSHRTYVVQPGDTLWTIARQLQPEGDVRPLVDRLAERHGGSALQAGDRLDLAGLDGLGR